MDMESIVNGEKKVYSIKRWNSGFFYPVVVEFLRRWGGDVFSSGIWFLVFEK